MGGGLNQRVETNLKECQVRIHVLRLVKSASALEQEFDLVVMKMVADANDLAAKHNGAFVTTNVSLNVAEIGITEGASGPSQQEFKLYMEPSFRKHCSPSFPEIEFPALEVFTKSKSTVD
jgi:hypothetical protein